MDMDAGNPATARMTKSTCTTGTVEGNHRFEIRNYSHLREMLVDGEFVRSGSFSVAGYDWAVLFYPNGLWPSSDGKASVYVQLMTQDAAAMASYDLRFVRADSGQPCSVHPAVVKPQRFDTKSRWTPTAAFGIQVRAMHRLESNYVSRDRLIIDCVLRVVGKPAVSRATPLPEIEVPPPNQLAQLGWLFDEKEHADVTFDVQGEEFPAHRLVLAVRSPVFRAELFGPMSDGAGGSGGGGCPIKIGDMEPTVFKVLLRFIYTDSVPAMDDLDEDTKRDLFRHLLVAADRYDMDRLKVICEKMLSTSLTAQTVASTMAVAELHDCKGLKNACVEFVVSLGMNNEGLVSRPEEEEDHLNCVAIIEHFCKKIGSFLKIH